jgi:hypothetical protein
MLFWLRIVYLEISKEVIIKNSNQSIEMTKIELKKKNRKKIAAKTRKEQQRAGIFKKKT